MYGGEMLYGSHLCGEAKSSSEINGNAMRGYEATQERVGRWLNECSSTSMQ